MKPEKSTSVVMMSVKPKGGLESEGEEGMENHAGLAAAEDLVRAVHAKDVKAVWDALEAAFHICNNPVDHEEMGEE